jgi:acetyl esterase
MPNHDLQNFDLDPEIQSFIETTLRVSSNLSTDTSVEQQRENYDKFCRHFFYGYPHSVESSDTTVEGRHGSIPVRRYSCAHRLELADTQIVFIHGGGFILGSLDSHDDICAEICNTTGIDTISIDYRLSPEFSHPVHLDDVVDAYLACWQSNSITVGVSAGANLSAGLCHRLKTSSQIPSAQVLIYGALGGDLLGLDSYICNASAPLLSSEDIFFYRQIRCGNAELPIGDAEFYPLVAKDFSGLPPSVTFSADVDPLRDDSSLYVQKLKHAGVCAAWHNEPGLTHDYLRARHISQRAANAFRRICDEIRRLAQHQSS